MLLSKPNAKKLAFLLSLMISIATNAEEINFVTIEVVPWASVDAKTGESIGMFPEIVSEIERLSGVKINTALTPYARINKELEAARQDCTILITEDERSKITTLGSLVFDHPMGVIAHKSIDLKSYDDLKGLTVSVLRALSISKQFDADNEIKKEFDTDYDIGIRKIKHGRLEAVAGAIPTIQYIAKSNGYGGLLGPPLELSLVPIYLQCSNNSKKLHLLQKINAAIETMQKENIITDIVNKFTL